MKKYDVVICGGGIAALLLARELQLHQRQRSILIIEKQPSPSPLSCHKVGESILEGAAYYLRHTLELNDYLFENHMEKLGIRLFFGGSQQEFADRLEYGGVQWPPFPTFQLDRGLLENDLREMVIEDGATVLCDSEVLDVQIDQEQSHTVECQVGGRKCHFRARWLIDASGRRRFLASRLGLKKTAGHKVSAVWWRIEGRVDISKLVAKQRQDWHHRITAPRRYSTNVLAGEGYWVWIIPLSTGRTSIGIVASEEFHSIRELTTHSRALEWCAKHEPEFASLIDNEPALDFQALRNFTYSIKQAYSHQRWACIGDAAVLADALYGMGQDVICHQVSITAKLIELDFDGRLTEETVKNYDEMFLSFYDMVMDQFRGVYGLFGSSFHHTQKFAWDTSMYFAIILQTHVQNIYDNPEAASILKNVIDKLAALNKRMQRFFQESYKRDGALSLHHGMRTWAPRVAQFANSQLDKCAPEQLESFFAERLRMLEGIASVLFWEVVDSSPKLQQHEFRSVLPDELRINPYYIEADPERWEKKHLFDPKWPLLDLKSPAHFDVDFKNKTDRMNFKPLLAQFAEIAQKHANKTAVYYNDAAITYSDLVLRVSALANVLVNKKEASIGIDVRNPLLGLVWLMAAISAKKEYLVVDPSWGESENRIIQEGAQVSWLVNDSYCQDLQNQCSTETSILVEKIDDPWKSTVFWDARLTQYGPRIGHVNHAVATRICSWLSVLMNSGVSDEELQAGLHCAWVGPLRIEALVPLMSGYRLSFVPEFEAGGQYNLVNFIESHKIDVLFGRPDDFASLLEQGWPKQGLRVVSLTEGLPKDLSLMLRTKADRVCDFGFATFSH